ncbi:MAG: hypothetical protein K5668_08775 [Lachnospiraceae bacterium]|nr:hypothetical protein [Lachnospiraceae bacterium]
MSDSAEITKIILIKSDEEEIKYVVEINSLTDCIQSGDDLPAINVSGGNEEFCYIRINTKVLAAPLSFHLFDNDFFDYMDALKIKSVRHRNTWVDSPDADDILNDAEKRLHKHSTTYPGFSAFMAQAAAYDGPWTEYLPPL